MTIMTDLYFDDLEIGQVFESVGRTITNHDVLTYAGITGDNNEVHTNDEYAKNTPFKTRIVHGILVVGIASGLTQRLGIFNRSAMAALDLQWTFKAAVLIGDTIRVRITIENMRETSKGDRGIVTRAYDVLNQRGEVVQTGKFLVMMHKNQVSSELIFRSICIF